MESRSFNKLNRFNGAKKGVERQGTCTHEPHPDGMMRVGTRDVAWNCKGPEPGPGQRNVCTTYSRRCLRAHLWTSCSTQAMFKAWRLASGR